MKRFIDFIRSTWWLFLILFLAPIIVIALFACMEFIWHQINMEAGNWATLFGSAFGYWGTVILGTLAFWQNNQIQENNNILVNYERNRMAPIFSLLLDGYQGMLENLKFTLSNCSDNIACSIEVSDLEIYKITSYENESFISRTSPVKSNIVDILEAHSQMTIEYKNNSIVKNKNEIVLLVVNITASDIIGLTKTTQVKIYINANFECKYEYKVKNVTIY